MNYSIVDFDESRVDSSALLPDFDRSSFRILGSSPLDKFGFSLVDFAFSGRELRASIVDEEKITLRTNGEKLVNDVGVCESERC